MIMSRLTALALATLLSSAAFAANTAPSTGPTDPVGEFFSRLFNP